MALHHDRKLFSELFSVPLVVLAIPRRVNHRLFEVRAERQAATLEVGQLPWAVDVCLRVDTNSSALDAPVMALRAVGVRHRHEFSCDSAPSVRAFLEANTAEAGGPWRA